jgi:hypothetical protein
MFMVIFNQCISVAIFIIVDSIMTFVFVFSYSFFYSGLASRRNYEIDRANLFV